MSIVYFQLSRGTPFLLFDADGAAAPVNSQIIGVPPWVENIAWRTKFSAAPVSCDIRLQGALTISDPPVDADFGDLDSSTNVNGEGRQLSPLKLRYIRARKNAQVGVANLTVEIMG